MLPVDHVITNTFHPETMVIEKVSEVDGDIPEGMVGVDIGPKTVEVFGEVIASAKTVLWNGPMGIFEIPESARGTFGIAEKVASTKAQSIIGGGDSGKALKESGFS